MKSIKPDNLSCDENRQRRRLEFAASALSHPLVYLEKHLQNAVYNRDSLFVNTSGISRQIRVYHVIFIVDIVQNHKSNTVKKYWAHCNGNNYWSVWNTKQLKSNLEIIGWEGWKIAYWEDSGEAGDQWRKTREWDREVRDVTHSSEQGWGLGK